MTVFMALFVAGWTVAAPLGTQIGSQHESVLPVSRDSWRFSALRFLAKALTGWRGENCDRAIRGSNDRYLGQRVGRFARRPIA